MLLNRITTDETPESHTSKMCSSHNNPSNLGQKEGERQKKSNSRIFSHLAGASTHSLHGFYSVNQEQKNHLFAFIFSHFSSFFLSSQFPFDISLCFNSCIVTLMNYAFSRIYKDKPHNFSANRKRKLKFVCKETEREKK